MVFPVELVVNEDAKIADSVRVSHAVVPEGVGESDVCDDTADTILGEIGGE